MLENVDTVAAWPMLPTVMAGPWVPPELAGEFKHASVAELPAATTTWRPATEAAEIAVLRAAEVEEDSRDMDMTLPTKEGESLRVECEKITKSMAARRC